MTHDPSTIQPTRPSQRPARRRLAGRAALVGVTAGATLVTATLTTAVALQDADAPTAAAAPALAAQAAVPPRVIELGPTAAPTRRTAVAPRASRSRAAALTRTRPPARSTSRGVAVGRSFSGEASWYGPGFQGRRTASGERYDMYAMTAAHRSLAFGTRLRVCRAQRCVVVRINDRGPFVGDRVLDLSKAAAQRLGYSGTAFVTATPVR